MTYEEFQAGLAETPELLGTIFEKHEPDAIKHLTEGKKMVVTTMAEYTKDRQKAIDDTTKKAHTDWEEKIEKVTGQKRPEGKKGLEWFDELSAKIKYLDKEGDTDSAMMKAMRTELKELKESLSKKDQAAIQDRINATVSADIRGLRFNAPATLKTDAERTSYQRTKAEQMTVVFNSQYTGSVNESGQTVFLNKKGEAQVKDGEPMTADQIATRDFAADLAPKGRSQGGTGTDDEGPKNDDPEWLGATPEAISLKLAEMGLSKGSMKWREARKKAFTAAKLTME